MREGPNDVHLNQDEEVWAVAPSVRRQKAGGRRQEAGGSPHQMGIHFRLLHSVLVTPQVTMSDDG